jgi:hypothetical protein
MAYEETLAMEEDTPYTPLTPPSPRRHLVQIPWDLWYEFILGYCSLDTLLRLAWTHPFLRYRLNQPGFVKDWMDAAYFVRERGCGCDRGLYQLDLKRWLDFSVDTKNIKTIRGVDVLLRSTGRWLGMYNNSNDLRHRDARTIYPRGRDKHLFEESVLDPYYEGALVPLPRLVGCPVEMRRPDAMHGSCRMPWKWTGRRMADPVLNIAETIPEYNSRQYWQQFHEVVTDTQEYTQPAAMSLEGLSAPDPSTIPTLCTVIVDGPEQQVIGQMVNPVHPSQISRLTEFANGPHVDWVTAWENFCEEMGWEALDPGVDTGDVRGYRAVVWARDLYRRGHSAVSL